MLQELNESCVRTCICSEKSTVVIQAKQNNTDKRKLIVKSNLFITTCFIYEFSSNSPLSKFILKEEEEQEQEEQEINKKSDHFVAFSFFLSSFCLCIRWKRVAEPSY